MQEEIEQSSKGQTTDDATSSDTLSDVEEAEDVSDNPSDVAESVPLSPDGAEQSENTERQPKDDSGPM